MSGIINKVKDALHSDKENPNSASHGSHNKDTMNKADPRFDSDRDNRDIHSTTGHNTHNTGAHTGSHNTGAHSTGGIAPTHHSTTTGSTNDGPHNSSMMNKVDPRVDSDRDNRNDPLSKTGGYGHQENYGAQGANPMPSSGHQGQFGTTSTTGHSGVGSTGHTGLQSGAPSGPVYNGVTGTGATGHSGSNTAGPHNSSMMNKADPRVDSDRDNRNDPLSRTGGYGTQEGYSAQGSNPMPSSGHQGQYGQSGLGSTGTTGHHQSGPTGHAGTGHSTTGQHGYGQDAHASHNTPGSGNAPSTAGPHNSNLLNKLDPRVDSNLDGSKTVGGNKTHT